MCLEDLRLGRGRINRPTVQIPTGSPITINSDQSRVAILVVFSGSVSGPDSLDIFLGPDVSSANYFTVSPAQTMFVLRIEDLGQLITGQLTFQVNNVSATATVSVTEIYTEVNAPPLDTYKP